ncbi:UPF0481 protein [Camellia lanceoleosa]|uniref:UPF0481 protein n=1 Tax=Camellia lanceoleosa TaxID=1840588 RepID=A0ACC0IAT2_9ERIC|nr:UPF0481 protein [Camellia lanceoleosa]
MLDNKSSVSVPTGTSVRDDCHINEQALEMLAKDIEKKLAEGAHKSESKSSPACIYKVPEQLRKQKESAYTPHFVSIGPLHSKNEQIKNSHVQGVKLSYANSLFGRKILPKKEGKSEEDGKKSTPLEECVQEMSKLLERAKKCYAEEVEDVLDVEMLVIDGCFILELLYKFKHTEFNIRNDPIFDIHLMPIFLRNDLLLLENQLPFFVLQKLFDLTVARIDPAKRIYLTDYVDSFFDDMLNSEARRRRARKKRKNSEEYHHIVHILQNLGYFCSVDAGGENQTGLSKFMPCASDLEYAGVKFVVGSKVSFSDARGPSRLFGTVYFEIPSLCIYDTIEPVLRNLIAFEQCNCPGVTRFFTSYAFLMDTLINTPNDVQVLENAGVIRNYLGTSKDVTKLFRDLLDEVVLGESCFEKSVSAATDYSKRCWPDTMARLRRKYFSNPWSFVVFCTGLSLLACQCFNSCVIISLNK